MSTSALDWIEVSNSTWTKKIGAIGFLGDKAAVVTAYFDDLDQDNDGTVSTFERVASKVPIMGNLFFKTGRQLATVYMQALKEPDIVERDQGFKAEAGKEFLRFGSGLIFEGVYLVYFSKAVSGTAAEVAKAVTNSTVKQYVIRKGMEKAVKEAFDAAAKYGGHR